MDDHMFEWVYDYGMCELVPRFQKEYKEFGTVTSCPSYDEIKDFCKVLTLINKWDYTCREKTTYTPSFFAQSE